MTTTIQAAGGDLSTMLSNVKTWVQIIIPTIIIIAGLVIVAVEAIRHKFSIPKVGIAVAGILFAAFCVFQLGGLIQATKNTSPRITGNNSSYQ